MNEIRGGKDANIIDSSDRQGEVAVAHLTTKLRITDTYLFSDVSACGPRRSLKRDRYKVQGARVGANTSFFLPI